MIYFANLKSAAYRDFLGISNNSRKIVDLKNVWKANLDMDT